MKTAEEVLKKYSCSSTDAATGETTYREGVVHMAMEEYKIQAEMSKAEVETLIELHKHLDICWHNINSNLKEKLREIIKRETNW